MADHRANNEARDPRVTAFTKILEKIGAVSGDFGKVFVGEFGVVDCC